MPDRWNNLSDLSRSLRAPVILLIAATLIVGCYPNSILCILRPVFSSQAAIPNR
jgi:hypothetical protein